MAVPVDRFGQRADEHVDQFLQGGTAVPLVQRVQQAAAAVVHLTGVLFEDLPDQLFLGAEVVLGRRLVALARRGGDFPE